MGQILGTLCRRKGIEIIEAECCSDHIHILVRIPPKYSVSEVVGYLKGKSSLMIFEKHANLKYKYGNLHFWCRGYYWDVTLAPNFSNPHEHWDFVVFSKKFSSGKRLKWDFFFSAFWKIVSIGYLYPIFPKERNRKNLHKNSVAGGIKIPIRNL